MSQTLQSFHVDRPMEMRGLIGRSQMSDAGEYSLHDVSLDIKSFDAGRSHMLHTRYGTITVTVQGATHKPYLITFPEVGLYHTNCFQPLLSASAGTPLLLENFCILQIDPPGTGAGLEEVSSELQAAPSIDAYVDMVHCVLANFQVQSEAIGLGVGVGAYILARAALDKPNLFCGLILISPTVDAAGLYERVVGTGCIWTSALPEHLVSRQLGNPSQLSDLGRTLKAELKGHKQDGAAVYLKAAIARTSIISELPKIKCRVLLVGGEQSLYRDDLWKATSTLRRDHFAYLTVDSAGMLLTAEAPQQLLGPIRDFLKALQLEGYGDLWDLD